MKKRKLLDKLMGEKDSRKISIVLGARQVGKTTLLKGICEILSQKNKCLFLNLDLISNIENINTFEKLVNTLKLNGYDEAQKDFFYVFLDEFQRYPGLTMIMKNVYDTFNNVKIYASGSSSLRIKEQIQESLAGRKNITILYPLDFEEFLWFKGEDASILMNTKKLSGEGLAKVTHKLYDLLKEFMIFGGYPEVALEREDKGRVLRSIFDLYVDKDLIDYLKIEKISNVKKAIEYLAVNNGQKIKYEEIAAISSLSYPEVKRYIEILKETFVVCEVRPFFTNKNKELVKIPKIYFVDNGVRNFFVNNFNPLHLREDSGFLFEGYVLSELLKLGVQQDCLKFWQDKNMHEVDIIIDKKDKQTPIEIKFKSSLKKEDFLGLKAFLEQYPKIKKGYIINIGVQKEIENTKIMLPYVLDFL